MAATLGDAVIMLSAFGMVAAMTQSKDWVRGPKPLQVVGFIVIGLIVTIVVEIIATRTTGPLSWCYTAAMPVTPSLHIGFSPLLMWVVVPLLVLWFARRQIGHLALLT